MNEVTSGAPAPVPFSFVVPGEAVPWARARLNKGMHFTPKKQADFGALIKLACQRAMNGHAPLDGPVDLLVVVMFLIPKSAPKRVPPRFKTSRPDIDNHAKIVMDALNKIAWHDDAQVCSLTVRKEYGINAGLSVVFGPAS